MTTTHYDFSQTKFVASKNTKSHKVKGKLPNSAKKMKACADGNNEMFKRRRMPEPLVVQQMKVGEEKKVQKFKLSIVIQCIDRGKLDGLSLSDCEQGCAYLLYNF